MPVQSDVEDAIASGFETLRDLRDEIRDAVEAMSESPGLAATGRYQTLSDTADSLDNFVDDEPSVPECVGGERCEYTENREKKLTRSGRLNNATAALTAAADAIRSWIDDQDADDEDAASDIADAEQLADELEGYVSEAEGCEFPGMYG